jgi:thiol:disulfide interchange protein DsbD
MKPVTTFVLLLALSASSTVAPQTVSERLQNLQELISNNAQQQFLHPDQAFVMAAAVQGPSSINVYWQIADGYYLYHDKFSFAIEGDGARVDSGAVVIPPGHVKQDPSFGSIEVNTGEVGVDLPLVRNDPSALSITLRVGYQGCKDNSLCYPPIIKSVPLVMAPQSGVDSAGVGTVTAFPTGSGAIASQLPSAMVSAQDSYTLGLLEGNILLNMLVFFGAGLLLSLTPCVFPMVPILSGIIVGQNRKLDARWGLILSLTYVLAMALTYAVIGVIAAMAGINVQAAAQNIWVITAFCLVFVALAFSMFGFYEIRLPAAVQDRLLRYSNSQSGGTLSGVVIMGAVSAVIVGPCVAPPLIGALAYISQTGNEVLGASALFAMGLGMGAPLLIIGASAGTWLPRSGLWMETIKQIFGVGLLGLGIWFLARVIPPAVELYLWAALLIVSAIYMGAMDQLQRPAGWSRLWKGLGLIMLVYGVILIIGASSGGTSLYQPLQGLAGSARGGPVVTKAIDFKRIKTVSDLDAELDRAGRSARPVMLDFYADWCIECVRMEAATFPDPDVHAALREVVLLQADVTRNDEQDRELLQRFGIYGPPAILFFGVDGKEKVPYRLFGFVSAEKFSAHVRAATASGI